MSDEETIESTPEPEKKVRKPRAPKVESLRVVCGPRTVGYLFDPDRNVRIPANGQNPVELSGPVREGSWLDCQIKAGLIKVS